MHSHRSSFDNDKRELVVELLQLLQLLQATTSLAGPRQALRMCVCIFGLFVWNRKDVD